MDEKMDEKTETYIIRADRTYKCPLCNRAFRGSNQFAFTKHLEEMHNYKIDVVNFHPLQLSATPPDLKSK